MVWDIYVNRKFMGGGVSGPVTEGGGTQKYWGPLINNNLGNY